MSAFEPPRRRPSINVEVGKFVASLGYDPDTGVTYEVFFSRRGKKVADSGISEDLYELGVAISKEMQNLLGTKNGNI